MLRICLASPTWYFLASVLLSLWMVAFGMDIVIVVFSGFPRPVSNFGGKKSREIEIGMNETGSDCANSDGQWFEFGNVS
jgi:hypothetical protein